MRWHCFRVISCTGVLLLVFVASQVRAQFPGVGGVPGQGGIPGQQRAPIAFPDTAEDEAPARKVARSLRRVSPAKVRYTTYSADSIYYDIFRVTRWDEVDTLDGWVQSLGSIGKPQLRYLNGLPEHYRESSIYRDPLTGRADVYTLTPEYQLPYFDTRTPLVQIRFDQASKSVQLLSFDISQNVNPFWNVTLHYRRRTSLGAYTGSTVDHYAIGVSMNFTSYSRRFAATLGTVANLQTDQLNGGLFLRDESGQSVGVFDNLSVNKFTVPTQLNGAVLQRRTRLVHGVASLRLLGDTANAITLVAGGRMTEAWRKYTDRFVSLIRAGGDSLSPLLNARPDRPYGRINFLPFGPDTTQFFTGFSDEYLVYQPAGFVGARFNVRVGSLAATLQGELETQYLWAQDSLPGNTITRSLEQTKNTLRAILLARDTAQLPRFQLRAVGELSTNTLLGEEFKISGEISWSFGQRRYTLADSQWREVKTRFIRRAVSYSGIYTPLRVGASVLLQNRNPALFDVFWPTSTFTPERGLRNETVLSLVGQVRYEGRPRTGEGYPLLPNYAAARVFFSSIVNPVVYDSAARPVQGGGGEQLLWQGLTLSGRIRAWRFYLENQTTLQAGVASGGLERFTRAQPNLFGQASAYFRTKVFKEGQTYVQAGVDANYFTEHRPLSLEPSLQSWYPQYDRPVNGYLRLDGYVSASIGNALVYVKYVHFNEFAFDPAYFTTPYYPMLERSFCFGVVWRFFD